MRRQGGGGVDDKVEMEHFRVVAMEEWAEDGQAEEYFQVVVTVAEQVAAVKGEGQEEAAVVGRKGSITYAIDGSELVSRRSCGLSRRNMPGCYGVSSDIKGGYGSCLLHLGGALSDEFAILLGSYCAARGS